MIITYVITY